MGSDASGGGMLSNIAGRAVGAIGALASLKGGGLVNYMMARERMLSDPSERAALVNSPFTAGFFGLGQGSAPSGGAVAGPSDGTPAAGGVVSPGDARYLPAGGSWYPDVSPLAYEQQVKEEAHRADMIGLTSADPTIRAQSKMAIGVPLSAAEITGPTGHEGIVGVGRQIVGAAGPGSQVRYNIPGGDIVVGSPYIAGNYMDYNAAKVVADRTGQTVVPGNVPGTYDVKPQQQATESEFLNPADAANARQPGEETVKSGKTINGQPVYINRKVAPTGVQPLEGRPATAPAPAPPPARPAAKPAPAPAPAQPAEPAATAPPPPPPPPARQAAPAQPAPPPTPPEVPPHEVLRQNPDGSFSPVPTAPPPRAPRAQAAPSVAPPMLAAGAPPLFQFPGGAAPAEAAPVMVASAAPPATYQLVPGSELSGVASGAPPAPVEERRAPPPPVVPAPAVTVPYAQPTPGQPGPGAAATPGGLPPGTQSYSEERPIIGPKGEQEGTVSTQGKTQAGLDYERQQAEILKQVEQQYGKVPEAEKLAALYTVRRFQDQLLNEYTPEQRDKYQGYVQPYLQRFFQGDDPRYQHFLELNEAIRGAMQAAGLPAGLSNAVPTGEESTAARYEQRLRSGVDAVDNMIYTQSTLANAHPAELTHAQQQKIINAYSTGPATVHYGAYPWDEKGNTISTQQTPTSAPPTTTTLYPVDVRRTVQSR